MGRIVIAAYRPKPGREKALEALMRRHHERLRAEGWSPAVHAMPLGPDCGLKAHAVISAAGLPLAPGSLGFDELVLAVESRVAPSQVVRLSDQVLEPDDHQHD